VIKAVKWIVILVVVVAGGAFGWFSYSAEKNKAAPAAAALAAMGSDAEVAVTDSDWLVMQPANATPTRGVIIYPGAYCDIHGYAQLMRAIAASGQLVVGIKMPFGLALFGVNKADDVREAYPDINSWTLIGHSLGGAMGANYAFNRPGELAGMIFWDSHPPAANSLAEQNLTTVHIHRATLAGEPPAKFTDMAAFFPANTQWVPVPGGIHMYFGSFDGGSYVEEWEPEISNAAQLEIITAATLNALDSMR
jgi:hypothetical protein